MSPFYRKSIRLWLIGLSFSVSFFVNAEFPQFSDGNNRQEQHNPSTSQRLFDSNRILNLTIQSDFSSIMNDRGDDRSYHKGILKYINVDGDSISRKIKLKTRGNFRRDPANCKYPPIMIKFGKLKGADSVFAGQSKLKLVTQCQHENYVLLEYLAYRMYNQLSDQSYRVRLAHISYTDINTQKIHFTRYAFFIENENQLAERLNAEVYKHNVVQYFLDRNNVITMAMFQYLIGNDDWYTTSKHNVSILKSGESLIAVPYDFDWSKFVDAKYSKPYGVPDYQIKDRRVYKGLCLERDELTRQQDMFNAKKETLIQLVNSIEHLPKGRRQTAVKYLDQFYKILNNPSSLNTVFQKDKCISEPQFQ